MSLFVKYFGDREYVLIYLIHGYRGHAVDNKKKKKPRPDTLVLERLYHIYLKSTRLRINNRSLIRFERL